MQTNQKKNQDVKSSQDIVVERQFEGELNLTLILKSWIKNHLGGEQE